MCCLFFVFLDLNLNKLIRAFLDNHLVKLIEDRICRLSGEVLLKETPHFGLQEFLKMWQDSVPEGKSYYFTDNFTNYIGTYFNFGNFKGLVTNLRHLDGLVYVNVQRNQRNIYYCPEHELPEDAGERIQCLFKLKDKWTIEEIKPYIK